MNKFVALFFVIAVSSSIASRLPALHHEEIHDDFGQYALRYYTAEGTFVSERGYLIPTADGKDHVMAVEGEVSYIGADGKSYSTKYMADLEGFRVIEPAAVVAA
ncbi:unnamed protein product [Diatraea saccharalis]|uniref:Uncharacterized protein n=1 Tax=Diatraea saccharalis TaxID=40085 RepID=A0A9N9QX62_9NEOP|nr:unnamed protein product [Diatraea saccharalis]